MVSFKMILIYPIIKQNPNSRLNTQVENMIKYDMTDKLEEFRIYLDFLDLKDISIGTVYFEITEYCLLLKKDIVKGKSIFPNYNNDVLDDSFLLKKRSLGEFLTDFNGFISNQKDYDYSSPKKIINELNMITENNEIIDVNQKPKDVAEITSLLSERQIADTDFTFFKYNKIINFSFIDLDHNFADFFENNLYKKCELCKQVLLFLFTLKLVPLGRHASSLPYLWLYLLLSKLWT